MLSILFQSNQTSLGLSLDKTKKMATVKRPVGRPRKDSKQPTHVPKRAALIIKADKEVITPINKYAGYNIRRTLTGRVLFGCGAVKLARKDLLTAADALRDKEFVAAVTPFAAAIGNGTMHFNILKATEQQAQLLKFVMEGRYSKQLRAVLTLAYSSNGNRTFEAIMKISPNTLLGLAGPAPKNKIMATEKERKFLLKMLLILSGPSSYILLNSIMMDGDIVLLMM